MEGLWILLGGAITAVSGVIFWFLNSRTAREVQEREERHELQMQEQRLQAERQSKEDDAVRAMRRTRLQPLFDVLAELDNYLAYCSFRRAVEEAEQAGVPQRIAAHLFPEGVSPERLRRMQEEVKNLVPDPPADLSSRALISLSRIGDEGLREEMSRVFHAMFKPGSDWVGLASKMADIHARLERYAASIHS